MADSGDKLIFHPLDALRSLISRSMATNIGWPAG
jgi:hypothetical protein